MPILSIFGTLLTAAVLAVFISIQYFSSQKDCCLAVSDFIPPDEDVSINGVPYSTRLYWMRRANEALFTVTNSPCPFQAFGSVVVNHTNGGSSSLGDLICIGANGNLQEGNPTLHGEIAAINNCTAVLQDVYGLTPHETLAAFSSLSLYTNAESCPMCASAIRWAGFREYIYGTTIDRLIETGWPQIRIASSDVFLQAEVLPSATRLIGKVLTNETDPYFSWQFDPGSPCPAGCGRHDGFCSALKTVEVL